MALSTPAFACSRESVVNAENLKSTQQLLNKSTSAEQFGLSLLSYSELTSTLIAQLTETEVGRKHWNRQSQYRITDDIFDLALREAEVLQADSTLRMSPLLWLAFSSCRSPTEKQRSSVASLSQRFFDQNFSKYYHTDSPEIKIEVGLNLVTDRPFLAGTAGT